MCCFQPCIINNNCYGPDNLSINIPILDNNEMKIFRLDMGLFLHNLAADCLMIFSYQSSGAVNVVSLQGTVA